MNDFGNGEGIVLVSHCYSNKSGPSWLIKARKCNLEAMKSTSINIHGIKSKAKYSKHATLLQQANQRLAITRNLHIRSCLHSRGKDRSERQEKEAS